MTSEATTSDEPELSPDEELKQRFGYTPRLFRGLGGFGSFMFAFSMITVTTTCFTLFGLPFTAAGGYTIWLWIPVIGGVYGITRVYGHVAARVPLTGYAYQWASRIVNPHYGWFTGWNALLCTLVGSAGIAVDLAAVFAPDLWTNPTHSDIVWLAATTIVVATMINVVSIRVTKWFNNVGASMELIGTVGFTLALAFGLISFHHVQGPGVLVQVGSSTGSRLSFSAISLALLLPVYTLAGWEGSADLAEETKDPRATVPRAMGRSVLVAGIVGIFVYGVFAMAIPGKIDPIVNSTSANPMLTIFQDHYGNGPADVLQAIVFAAIFAAVLVNLTSASRTLLSLSRDNMVPFSRVWAQVNSRTQTPIYGVILVALVAIGVNLLAGGVVTNVLSVVNVALYLTYGSTCVAVLIAHRRGTIPEAPPQYYGLGRRLVPVTVVTLLFCLVVLGFTILPASAHTILYYAAGFEAAGVVWYFAAVRRRLRAGDAGPRTTEQQPD